MAVGVAIPSHAGEPMVSFVKDANEKFCAPVSNFLGLKCRNAGLMELHFEDYDGTMDSTIVTLTCEDDNGNGMKRAAQAIALAMAGSPRIGGLIEIVDDVKGTSIHPGITLVGGSIV